MPFPEPNSQRPPESRRTTHDLVEKANRYLSGGEDETYRDHRYGEFRPFEYARETADIVVPVMRMVVNFSANRVAGREVVVSSDNEAVSLWLQNNMRDTDFHPNLIRGLKWGASYGGFYMKPTMGARGVPAMRIVRPDQADPEWDGSRLKGVCFEVPLARIDEKYHYTLYEWHHMVPDMVDGTVVLDGSGFPQMVSVIDYSLYRAKSDMVTGFPVGLDLHPDTIHLADLPTVDMVARWVLRGFDRIAAEYVPNTAGRYVSWDQNEGEPDLAATYDLLDMINLGWATIGDEMDKGRPRLMVSQQLAESNRTNRRGLFGSSGRNFESFVSGLLMEIAGPPSGIGGGTGIQQLQWNLQLNHRLDAVDRLRMWVVQTSGWSPQSFSLQTKNEAGAESGVSKQYREEQSYETTEQKRALLMEPLRRILTSIAILGGQPPADISVSFPPQNVMSDMERTEIAVKRWGAGVETLEGVVRYIHPEFSDAEVEQHAEAIREENAERHAMGSPPDNGNNLAERTMEAADPDGEMPAEPPII